MATGITVMVAGLYVVPWMRGPLDASTQLIAAALFAGLAGAGWRVVADMVSGSRPYWRVRDVWVMIGASGALSLALLAWHGWHAPILASSWEAILTLLTRLLAGGLMLIAVAMGYGDDRTWREEYGLAR